MKREIYTSEIGFLKSEFSKEFTRMLHSMRYQETITIGLSGGSSLDHFYTEIRERWSSIDEDIRRRVRFAWLDERIVPGDHSERNERQLREKFLTDLIDTDFIQDSQILSVDIKSGDIAGDYSRKVLRIDIALFGVGPDGHIASLFPHHPLLESSETGYLEITDSPKLPAHRITVSPEMIRQIQYVFIAFIQGKERAFENFRNIDISIQECPAKIVEGAGEVVVMSDIDR